MATLRFGLLGTGHWAVEAHGKALAASPQAVLRGVWGRDPAKAREAAARLGVPSYEDLDALLGDVDAVAVALAPDVQAQLAVRAANAGCHLLMDKPLALSVPAAEAVAEAVKTSGVAAIIFFTARFRPEVEAWVQAAAEAGPWQSAHLVHYANIFQPGSPYAGSPWRRERGALWDVGPHGLAAVLPIMGSINSISARRGAPGTDTVHLVTSHSQGGTSLLSLSLTAPLAAITNQLVLYGEQGARARPEGGADVTEVYRNAVADLALMVERGDRAHRCDTRFGLEVVSALAAAEQALSWPGVAPSGQPAP